MNTPPWYRPSDVFSYPDFATSEIAFEFADHQSILNRSLNRRALERTSGPSCSYTRLENRSAVGVTSMSVHEQNWSRDFDDSVALKAGIVDALNRSSESPVSSYLQIMHITKRLRFVLFLFVCGTSILPAQDAPETAFSEMTPGEVRAFEIEVLEKVADLALIPPTPNTSPLPAYGYDRLDYGMTIGIERTPGGRLWACWVAGGDSPDAFFVLATSDDDGETWSQPRMVLDSHSENLPRKRSILVGNLWTDPQGRLWLYFDQSIDMFDGRAGVWATICENPDADEPAWSRPRRIWHGVTLNKPTVLASGEWMLPISLDQRGGFGPFRGCFRQLNPVRGANVFVSTDEGETWDRRGMVTFPNPNWHEHMIVQRRDGSLWMLARTGTGIMESTSTDAGRTWSEPVSSAIQHPVARFFIRRLASKQLILVKHGLAIDRHEGRSQLSAWLSDDDGTTWEGGLVLDERKGVSYPDGFQAPNGTIYISYDRNRSTDGEILMARFTEEDVRAGRLVHPVSRLKMLISRPLREEQR